MNPIDAVIRKIKDALPEGKIFRIKGMMTATVMFEDGSYRKKPLSGGEELFLANIREGKSGRLIFAFEPVDASPYKAIEFTEADVGDGIEDFTAWIEEALGTTLAKAKVEAKREARRIKAEEQQAEALEMTQRYERLPNWGSW